MSDTGDDYKALAEMRKQERAERRAAAEARLQGLQFTVHNGGAHIVIPVAADSYVSWCLGEGDDPAVDWAQSQS